MKKTKKTKKNVHSLFLFNSSNFFIYGDDSYAYLKKIEIFFLSSRCVTLHTPHSHNF